MAYLKFNKAELVNLEYSLKREILATNRAGGYVNTTIVCCNTRKYHGLLALPVEKFNNENHILLSALDETIVQYDQSFNLGIHRYPGIYEPRGHKYIVDFEYDYLATITYRVGGVVLKKELMLIHDEGQLLIRYTLEDAHSPTKLRLKPFLAFRNIHQLSKANMEANTRYEKAPNGIRSKLYEGFPYLHMQLNKTNEFVPNPDWYYNIEYLDEKRRGYDYHEDLFVPGYFELPIKKGESIVFSVSVEEEKPTALKALFDKHRERRKARNSYENCLKVTANQFIVRRKHGIEIMGGYPWEGRWSREAFIALPGLMLSANYDEEIGKKVLDTVSEKLPPLKKEETVYYNAADVPMWYFWALQQYDSIAENAETWKRHGKKMKDILEAYRRGKSPNILMHDNGLIWAAENNAALTWMNACDAGRPVTPRSGYAVEINALWYNAVRFTLALAKKNEDKKFVKEWEHIPALIEENFMPMFWITDKKYLADYVDAEGQNIFVRPNQIFACSLPYTPLPDDAKQSVLQTVKRELLTPKGIRTLAPKNPLYAGRYEGGQSERDNAYHQGTVFPWLLGHYIEANLRLYGKQFLSEAKKLVAIFEEDMTDHGLCSIPECYDGNPPYAPHGCVSAAGSVAEILRSMHLIAQYEKKKTKGGAS